MILIACVDEQFGTMFHNRRQSRDQQVIRDILDMVRKAGQEVQLRMTESTFSLFQPVLAEDAEASMDARMVVETEFAPLERSLDLNEGLKFHKTEDFIFLEAAIGAEWLEQATEVVLYHWNRRYPKDCTFDMAYLQQHFSLVETQEFQGKSHENIKKEVYRKNET